LPTDMLAGQSMAL